MMKESHPKEIKTTKMAKAKENVLNVEIQIISSESVQNYQETTIKEPSLEDHGVIATKMKKKRLKMKNVLWLKLLMRIESARATPKAHLPYARHSVSSTSAYHYRGSSSRQEDDDEDDGASRASTPSPTTYQNSLEPLDYQQYEVPTSSLRTTIRLAQSDLLNQTQQMHKELRGGFKSWQGIARSLRQEEEVKMLSGD
ncbi:hypothetical protein Tco_0485354 [Tanacetum coccineum]